MEVSEIREKGITRIIAGSNFDSETFTETTDLVTSDARIMKKVASSVDELNTSTDSVYFTAVNTDYDLYRWEP